MTPDSPSSNCTRLQRHCAALLALGALLSPAAGLAQTIDEAVPLLDSGNPEQIEEGIELLGLIGTADALPPLQQRIRRGLPPELLRHAITTLAAIGEPAGGTTLLSLSNHRRTQIRAESLAALGELKYKDAYPTLVHALSDAAAEVRSAAAVALGQLGDPTALPVLFQSLDKGNLEASTALGMLTPPSEVPRLLGYLEQLPFRSLSPAFTTVMLRKDIDDAIRLTIVARIADLATREVRDYLANLHGQQPDSFGKRVDTAILSAIRGIPE